MLNIDLREQQDFLLVLRHFNTSCVRDAMMLMITDINSDLIFFFSLLIACVQHPRVIFTHSIGGKLNVTTHLLATQHQKTKDKFAEFRTDAAAFERNRLLFS